jgi:hypothetical protein
LIMNGELAWQESVPRPGVTWWAALDPEGPGDLQAVARNCACNSAPCNSFNEIQTRTLRLREAGVAGPQVSAGLFVEIAQMQRNYWGVFPRVDEAIHQMVVGTVEFADFRAVPNGDTGPRPAE